MKKIVIVGASSGIGYACAEALASRGVKIGVAARKVEKLKELKKKYPDFVEYERIDVTHPKATEQLYDLIEKLGGMDIYFHVAGIGYSNPDMNPETEVKIFTTNTIGFSRCIAAAYRYFKSHGIRGQIAALTSVAGTNGIGQLAAYSASKAANQKWLVALEQLSYSSGAGISFTDIRPGWIRTPLVMSNEIYPMEMEVDYVVPQILKAIIRKKRVAVIDLRWNILVGLWRMIPNYLYVRMPLNFRLPLDPQAPDLQK